MAEMFPELSSKYFKVVRTIKTVSQLLCVCTNFLHTHCMAIHFLNVTTMQCSIEFAYFNNTHFFQKMLGGIRSLAVR